MIDMPPLSTTMYACVCVCVCVPSPLSISYRKRAKRHSKTPKVLVTSPLSNPSLSYSTSSSASPHLSLCVGVMQATIKLN